MNNQDLKYRALIQKRGALQKTFTELQEASPFDDPIFDDMIARAETVEELQDLQEYLHFQHSSRLADAHAGSAWKTKSGLFKLVHVPTKVAMWTFPGPLPEWAFKQQEINGNKNLNDKSALWYADEIVESQGQPSRIFWTRTVDRI